MKYEFAKLCINNNKVQSFYLISEWNGPHTVVKLHFMSSWIFGNIQNPKLWFLTIFYMLGLPKYSEIMIFVVAQNQ